MNETWIGTIALIEFIILGIGCWFYMWGGRHGKWKRRFIGSLICSTAIWVGALLMGVFKLMMLGLYPLLILAFHLGYGSDVNLIKIIKRTIIVLATLTTGVLMCFALGGRSWLILPLQALISAGSIWLGTKSIIYAPAEEFFICLLLTGSLMLYPFVTVLG